MSGPIPSELGSLAHLEELALGDNQLSGPIPPAFASLANLEWLELRGNQLSGEIPPELGSLTHLEWLDLSDNQLNGQIPPEFGSLLEMQYLNLNFNLLSGVIPSELGNLYDLDHLLLGNNLLRGEIPPELSNMGVVTLTLKNNQLSGQVPPGLGSLHLYELDLSSNRLTGAIPLELGNLSNLQELWLGSNDLSGSIPPELGKLANLETLTLDNNQLSGEIPSELGDLSGLTKLFLSGNQLTGCVPNSLRTVVDNDFSELGLPFCPTAVLPTLTIAQLVENVRGGVVQIITTDGSGSGFIIDSDGRVATNHHVVGAERSVTVKMFDGKEYQANVLGVDAVADLAIVDIDGGSNIQAVPLGDSDSVRVGEEVIAMGFPLDQSPTVSRGIISALRPNHFGTGVDYLQTDAAINPGNSGGPLFNRAGQVIGVNTLREFISSDGRPVDNIAFAVAINELKERLEDLKAGRDVFAPRTEWRWDSWSNADYDWSISIPPGWSFDPDGETWQDDDGSGLVQLYVHSNLSADNILGLDAYARWWKADVESWGAENYPQSFKITSFEKKTDRGGRQFYSLEYENFNTSAGCWEHWMNHIFADGNYGAVIEGSICSRDVVTDEDWGEIPEILDSFELHHSEFADIYRNNLYGHSLDLGLHYYLDTDGEERDFSSFSGFEGSTRVAFVNVWTFEASEGEEYVLDRYAPSSRQSVIDYAEEQGWPLFEAGPLNKSSETSAVDGVTRQWYEFTYREQSSASTCVLNGTMLLILEDSKARGKIAYIVDGAVCEGHLSKWGPLRDAALDSFRP